MNNYGTFIYLFSFLWAQYYGNFCFQANIMEEKTIAVCDAVLNQNSYRRTVEGQSSYTKQVWGQKKNVKSHLLTTQQI